MPDEIDVPIDEVQDKISEIHKERFHGHHSEPKEGDGAGWTRYIGVATAILAVVAAIAALYSGLLVNESLLEKNEQIGRLTQASDAWNYYQAEGLKSLIFQTAAQSLPPASRVAKDDLAQAKHYKQKQDDLKKQADQLAVESEDAGRKSKHFLDNHHTFAYCVSLCQIAIALSAVAALTKRPRIWYLGLAAGLAGVVCLAYGFLRP